MGVVDLGGADQFVFQFPEQGVVSVDQFEVEIDTALDLRVGEELGGLDPVPQDMEVSRIRQVVLTGGVVDVPLPDGLNVQIVKRLARQLSRLRLGEPLSYLVCNFGGRCVG